MAADGRGRLRRAFQENRWVRRLEVRKAELTEKIGGGGGSGQNLHFSFSDGNVFNGHQTTATVGDVEVHLVRDKDKGVMKQRVKGVEEVNLYASHPVEGLKSLD